MENKVLRTVILSGFSLVVLYFSAYILMIPKELRMRPKQKYQNDQLIKLLEGESGYLLAYSVSGKGVFAFDPVTEKSERILEIPQGYVVLHLSPFGTSSI
jgi:hypothetical protein